MHKNNEHISDITKTTVHRRDLGLIEKISPINNHSGMPKGVFCKKKLRIIGIVRLQASECPNSTRSQI